MIDITHCPRILNSNLQAEMQRYVIPCTISFFAHYDTKLGKIDHLQLLVRPPFRYGQMISMHALLHT